MYLDNLVFILTYTLFFLGKEKTNLIYKAITKYIVSDMRPFYTIETNAFKELLKSIEPRLIPPNTRTLKDNSFEPLYLDLKNKIFQKIHQNPL